MSTTIELDRTGIADFCRRHPIRRLALFGSALRDDFSPDSDVDFWVEFKPDARVGLFKIASMERELSQIVGRKADLKTAPDLSKYFGDVVVRGAEVLYEVG